MISKIGKEEIKKALENIELTKEEYEAVEFDQMICDYYGVDVNNYCELTEKSHDFSYVVDVFEYIDSIISKKGYESNDDMTIYRKVR